MEDTILVGGFLLVAASAGMGPSSPLVRTFVMHREDGILIVTMKQYTPASGEFTSAQLRRLWPDGVVDDVATLAFEGDWTPPGFTPTRLLPRPEGGSIGNGETLAILARCVELAES